MMATAAIAQKSSWKEALADAISQIAARAEEQKETDLALFFASGAYAADFPDLLAAVQERAGGALVAGCSGWGIIGPSREMEGIPALALMEFPLPGARLHAVHISQLDLEDDRPPEMWREALGVGPEDVNAWLLFADPFSTDTERLLNVLSDAYPDTPVVGGLASGDPASRRTHVFLNGAVYGEGAVAIALGGEYTVRTVVSQGCEPIGEAWTITGAEGHVIETIGQRPAYEVLVDTIRALPPALQWRAQRNIFIGLAMNEYRDEFRRGDFLVRNLLGADPERGALAVGANPRVGQTVQFQLRDPQAADEDLREMLSAAKQELGENGPVGALLCACNGRGSGLFGRPDHDARAIAEQFGALPIAGFFCNGEIGPVGSRNFLHGYTASIALIVRKDETSAMDGPVERTNG
jgi:small ligand-binding sensory domain FIST